MTKQHPKLLRQSVKWIGSAALTAVLLAGCASGSGNNASDAAKNNGANANTSNAANQQNAGNTGKTSLKPVAIDTQPSTVYYEVFVRSFYDSDGDGIGDFKGLTEKLDYLNDGNPDTDEDLGIGGIWLMPINPSPSYHGYDVSDYRDINPDYGTLEDFKTFLDEAHKRGIKVIMDLVVNHSSIEHPWFLDAAKNKDSKYRDWYIWAEDQNLKTGGTSAAGSGNPWHSAGGSHYKGIFWEGMPDLNFDNPEVRQEMKDTGLFWLEQGVDGFRLDAAKHIYEDLLTDKGQETTDKNVKWWQEFRESLVEKYPDTYLVGEIWDPSPALIANYLDNALESGFNFGLSETIINAAKKEKNNNIGFTLERTYSMYSEKSGGQFVDATFLTNHDINRVMTQLEGNTDHAKMAAGLLLTLPGNPFLYYGEEIGMLGAKPDESIREPMQWYAGGKGEGQTTWEPVNFNTGEKGSSVEEQLSDPDSLQSHYRKLIAIRNSVPALQDGTIRDMDSGNDSVTAFLRLNEQQTVLVAHNLTGTEQSIDLSKAGDDYSFKSILKATREGATLNGSKLTIPGYTTLVIE
ncbi:alpha-amylase family glycosyl hydrolase [Paenibacillus sp. FSL R5-0407]|uniref:alpha-amylase family glycosyl hydrolase n=1 Tax=Paenibacillus TaxID=44249 RepID=UPI0025B65EA5|nr:alpha-amylase family glycosyl hydrolase [Paenibacillus vini]MDN4069614.1 alpha-amylase family glycosyl hydrolase [Paenibacillus vini]